MAYRVYVCQRCGRSPRMGYHRPHSQHRTKRVFHANIQKVTFNGETRWLCTRCIKELTGSGRKVRV